LAGSLVIIPTYNERENIVRMIETVFRLETPFHLLVVDDGSPDGTGELVKEQQKKYGERLFLLERKGKSGLGTAYIAGFRWALEKGYDYIFEMDCDFSHNPNDLERLLAACQKDGADIAVGSRYVDGGKLENWPADRIFLSKGASFYVRMVTFMPVKDPTAGFICYSRKVLESIDFEKIKFVGYAFQIEMKYAAYSLGFTIKEVPITFVDRVEGVSKMSGKIIKEAILGVLKMRAGSLFNSYGVATRDENLVSATSNPQTEP
jgi:dolichol-phosphate mannosyltransferase